MGGQEAGELEEAKPRQVRGVRSEVFSPAARGTVKLNRKASLAESPSERQEGQQQQNWAWESVERSRDDK